MNVELNVEELVLHGFAPGDRHPVGEAIKLELERLFVERGVPPALGKGDELTRPAGSPFITAPVMGAEAIGAAVARAVYEGFDR